MTLFSVDVEDRGHPRERLPNSRKTIPGKKKSQLILSIGFREGIVNKYEVKSLIFITSVAVWVSKVCMIVEPVGR